jgi:hypothetical protein
MDEPAEKRGDDLLGRGMPGWEKAIWALIAVYVVIVLLVFWYLGWSQLGFP